MNTHPQFKIRKGFDNESVCSVCKVMVRGWCGATLLEAEMSHRCHPLDVMVTAKVLEFGPQPTCHVVDTAYWLSKAS